ncbi:MAG TPA: DinB family protein [Gemmataceae bacterium]|nr:DinB family protein [Gemmataceae bacterium]
MTRLDLAVSQLSRARKYTFRLLENIDPALWFQQPAGGVTHIAWQVGHLANAEYRLCLERIRGRRPEDELLIPVTFTSRFARESVPDPDSAANPSPEEIRATLERVHKQVFQELRSLSDEELDSEPLPPRHPLFDTKLGAILWCAQHEMLHAGQIGLLRRLCGLAPLW